MGLWAKAAEFEQRMMTDDETVFAFVDRMGTPRGGRMIEVNFYYLAAVVGVVRRLRERVSLQEQQIAALQARLVAMEQQGGRPTGR
jgi:hypothetical protein